MNTLYNDLGKLIRCAWNNNLCNFSTRGWAKTLSWCLSRSLILSLSAHETLSMTHYITHAAAENITATIIIVGGVIGGLVALGLIIGFTIPLMILFSRRQDMQLSLPCCQMRNI